MYIYIYVYIYICKLAYKQAKTGPYLLERPFSELIFLHVNAPGTNNPLILFDKNTISSGALT